MRILVVEDDEFKSADIVKAITETAPSATIQRATSVTSALVAISRGRFDLVVLDMSLPTFEISGPGGGGSPQGQGGLEVLRLARRLENLSPFIVVTQYPDIELNGRDIPLSFASKALRANFGVEIMDCLLYEFDKTGWRSPLRECLEKIEGAR